VTASAQVCVPLGHSILYFCFGTSFFAESHAVNFIYEISLQLPFINSHRPSYIDSL